MDFASGQESTGRCDILVPFDLGDSRPLNLWLLATRCETTMLRSLIRKGPRRSERRCSVPETQSFSATATKRPISAEVAAAGNSSVFRHAIHVPETHTFSRNPASGCDSGSNALKSAAEFERFLTLRRRMASDLLSMSKSGRM